jgi:LuxR family maltose regulon positive regulatory protein
LIERPRLGEIPLRRALLVQGPAGYGKTVLLAQIWRALKTDEVFKPWLSLAPGRRAYMRFCEEVAGALAASGISPPAFGNCPEEDGARLAEHLALQAKPVIMTLDDYHAGASRDGDVFVRALLSQWREPNCVAIGTRGRLSIGAAALAAQGELAQIQAGDLAFTIDEARELLGEVVDAENIAVLHAQCEGWPAALQLTRRARARAIAQLNAPGSLVSDGGEVAAYLVEETFDPLPDELKALLIETALIASLDATGVDIVRARADSAAQLEALERSEALVFPSNVGGQVQRRHRLLQSFVEARFTLLAREKRSEITARSIELLSRRVSLNAAFELARRSDMITSSLQILEATPLERLWSVDALVDTAMFTKVDEASFKSAPRLATLRAVGFYLEDAMAEARRGAQQALLALRERVQSAIVAQTKQTACDALLWEGLSGALFDEEIRDAELGGLENAARGAAGSLQVTLVHTAASLALRAGRSGAARALARLCPTGAEASPNERALALATRALAALFDAAPNEAGAALAEARALDGADRGPFGGAIAVCDALLRYERGEKWEASALPEACAAPPLLGLSAEIFTEAARLAARAAFQASGFAAAKEGLVRALGVAVERGWRRAETALRAEELAIAASAGERKVAAALARELNDKSHIEAPEAALALAIHECAKGAHAGARARLASLLAHGGLSRRQRLRGLVLDARAAVALGAPNDANGALVEYLALCRDGAMAATFFEDGETLWEMITGLGSRLAPNGASDHRLETIAELAIARPGFTGGPALTPPSEQECALFAALRRNGARTEAARELGMSENTLKFYLKRAFKKWGVNDWRLAASVAEQLCPDKQAK